MTALETKLLSTIADLSVLPFGVINHCHKIELICMFRTAISSVIIAFCFLAVLST